MSTRSVYLCFLILACPATTYGQAYVFEGADYSYLHSPWFVIDECEFATGCEFTLNGVLGVQVDDRGVLKFPIADLELTDNEHLVDHPSLEYAPVTGDRVAELLRTEPLVPTKDDGFTKTYEWEHGNFVLNVNDNIIRLHGGRDSRPVDGDGVSFDATGTRTWIGDSNLDLRFNSADLVHVFGAGLYEDGVRENAIWSSGDWNGDLDFDSADLVTAFQDGGYDQGRRMILDPVPEPASIAMLILGAACLAIAQQRDRKR